MAKVMLVEDDNNLSEIYQARMMAEGYTVVGAHDGEEALALAAKEKPDLIISDVMMPKISGFEMLDILRNTQGLKDTKVIMLTALGQADDQSRAKGLGANRYLVKSQVTLEDIVKAAEELLGGDSAPAEATGTQTTSQPAPAPVPNQPTAPAPAEPVTPAQPTPAPVTMSVAQAPTPDTNSSASAAQQPTTATPPAENPPTTAPAPAEPVTPAQPTPVTPTNATSTPPDATQSTAQEGAAVQSQIANFEQKTPTATPTPVQQQDPANTATADDKVVADAVGDLVASATPAPPPVQPTPTVPSPAEQAPAQPTPATPPTPANVPQSQPPAPQAPANTPTSGSTVPDDDSAPIAGKKVIKPIEGGDSKKPDLNSLLAAEEAKSASTGIVSPMSTQPTTPSSNSAPAPAHPPGNVYAPNNPSSQNNTGIDPNSIAL